MNITGIPFLSLRGTVALLAIASCASTPVPSPETGTTPATPVSLAAQATSQGYQKTVLLQDLEHPWSLAWLPDGGMLITERPGRLRIFRNGTLDPTPVAGLPKIFVAGQGGLMEVSVHPKFAENRFIYFTYAHGTRESNRTRLARAKFDGTRLSDVQVIFEVSPAKPGTQHFGSRLVWLPDGTLLLATGDGGNPPLQLSGELIRNQAQNLRSYLGKIVRLGTSKEKSAPPSPWSIRNIHKPLSEIGKPFER